MLLFFQKKKPSLKQLILNCTLPMMNKYNMTTFPSIRYNISGEKHWLHVPQPYCLSSQELLNMSSVWVSLGFNYTTIPLASLRIRSNIPNMLQVARHFIKSHHATTFKVTKLKGEVTLNSQEIVETYVFHYYCNCSNGWFL